MKSATQNNRLFNKPGVTKVIKASCFAFGVINRYSASTSCTPLTSTRRSSIIAIITKVEGAQQGNFDSHPAKGIASELLPLHSVTP
jgi:hypothetical protein